MIKSRVKKAMVSKMNSIHDAIRAMDSSRFGIALIVDEFFHLISVVTDGDVRRAILNGVDLSSSVTTIMSQKPIILRENDSSEDVIELLNSDTFLGKAILIPVVDKLNIPVNIINSNDFVTQKSNKKKIISSERPIHVLLIGGGGYIGSVLTRLLLANNYKVTILDRFLYGEESLTGIKNHPQLSIFSGDTRHIDEVVPLVRSAEVVVHLAELVGDPLCARDSQTTFEINLMATATIARICSHLQVNRFVYISSCSVYGASVKPDALLTEKSELASVSLYASTKISAENTIKEFQNGNFSPCILRLGTVFGFSFRPRFDLVVNTLTAKAVADKEISIFGGNQWRPHVHVKDVSQAIKLVMEAPIEKVKGEIFNVVGENYKINDIGEMIIEVIPGTKMVISTNSFDQRNYRVSAEKFRKNLGFQPKYKVTDGIKELSDFLKKNPIIDYKDKRYHNILAI